MSIATGAHILVYPYQSSGHVIPLLDLTHQLLTRGLKITIAITPNNVPLLHQLISRHESSLLQQIVLPTPQTVTSKSPLLASMRSMREHHYPALLDWFQSHNSPPVAIISDFFLGWTQKFASQVGIKRLVFSPSGAFAFSVSASLWSDLPINNDPENMDFPVTFDKIPNSPTYPWWQISHVYRMGKPGDPDWEFYRECYLKNLESWGIVFNSFIELERVYSDHVKQKYGNNRVWAVGPVLPPDDDLTAPANRGGSSSVPCHEVMTWLDSHKNHSVIYVAFGSRTVLTQRQMDVLAAALENSGVHFIWCVRAPDERHKPGGDYGVLPAGFEDRVSGRGFIIKGWAPQVAILRHRAVGAFVTHCGWNSVLEGIAAGVVMLTWPMGADQFTNAQLLVDELGVGIRIGEETRRIPNSDELAPILARSTEENQPQRVKAKELQEAAMSAINKGGSSDRDLHELVKSLNDLKSAAGDLVRSVNGVFE